MSSKKDLFSSNHFLPKERGGKDKAGDTGTMFNKLILFSFLLFFISFAVEIIPAVVQIYGLLISELLLSRETLD